MGTRAISSIDACFVLGRSIPFGTGLTLCETYNTDSLLLKIYSFSLSSSSSKFLTRILFKKRIIWSTCHSLSECHSRHSNSLNLSCQKASHSFIMCTGSSIELPHILHLISSKGISWLLPGPILTQALCFLRKVCHVINRMNRDVTSLPYLK